MTVFSSLRLASVLSSALLLVACGDDGDGGGGSNGGGPSAGSDQGGNDEGGSGGESQGGAESGGAGGGGGGGAEYPPVECGDALTCEAGDVCIVEPNQPECTNLGKGETCPKGTTETNCGGAGIPCCCGPTPPPDYRCTSGAPCGGDLPSCECLDPCTGVDECIALAANEYTFQCEPPAKP